jgi:hypothetical protein
VRERLPPLRELLARLGVVVVELQQPAALTLLHEVAVVLRRDRHRHREDGRHLRPPPAERVEVLLPVPLLLLRPLLLHVLVVVPVHVVHPPLVRVRQRLVRRHDLLELRVGARRLVLVGVVAFGELSVRSLDLSLGRRPPEAEVAIKLP